jgi:hypothetical protein
VILPEIRFYVVMVLARTVMVVESLFRELRLVFTLP